MTRHARGLMWLAAGAVAATACTTGWTGAPVSSPVPTSGGSPFRVVESSSQRTVSFDDLVARASMADFVFFGEQHDDPETHFAEFKLLEAIGRQRSRVVLSLEMFERDVQPLLDDYLAGRMSEADFLANARPWDRYATDYRPLVVLARARGWRVIAANIPRPITSAVSRKGLAALDTLPPSSRANFVAAQIICQHDAYYTRFAQEMTGHSAGGGPPTAADAAQMSAMTDRFFEAQCIKDETMAESIARAHQAAGVDGLVVHFNGAFHTDYGQGTAARTLRRQAGPVHSIVITAVPVDDPSKAVPDDALARADYVILTKAPPRKPGG